MENSSCQTQRLKSDENSLFQYTNKMKLIDYFLSPQPINDEVENDVYYKNIRVVDFVCTSSIYVQIEIARVDFDLWAFGWTISDGGNNRVIGKPCTSRVITKGEISRLIYGMTKVLQKQVQNLRKPSFKIIRLIDEAIREAKSYTSSQRENGKIII